MYDDHSYPVEDMPDSLDNYFAQLLGDIPELLSIPTIFPQQPSSLPPAPSASSFTTAPSVHHGSDPEPVCRWVLSFEHFLICGALLPKDPKHTCTHFREAHGIQGNEKAIVDCRWLDCNAPPMQRGSLIRHVLSVHLGLLRWQCELCGRTFSRKGTVHACV